MTDVPYSTSVQLCFYFCQQFQFSAFFCRWLCRYLNSMNILYSFYMAQHFSDIYTWSISFILLIYTVMGNVDLWCTNNVKFLYTALLQGNRKMAPKWRMRGSITRREEAKSKWRSSKWSNKDLKFKIIPTMFLIVTIYYYIPQGSDRKDGSMNTERKWVVFPQYNAGQGVSYFWILADALFWLSIPVSHHNVHPWHFSSVPIMG